MRHPRLSVRTVGLAVVVLLLGLTPAVARPGTGPGGRDPLQPLDPGDTAALDPTLVPLLADPDRRVTVMIELQGEPVASAQGRALERGVIMQTSEREALRDALEAQQDALTDDVDRRDGVVLSQLQDAYNGLRVNVPASVIPELAGLPGVRGIEPVATYRPTNATSVPFLGVPELWESLDLTGEGISIGVIDTGIDYTHADFGGAGTPEAYERNDRTVVEEGSFPTAKVVGGYDFVGDDYNAFSEDLTELVPNPDPDPLDCNGHGTHVAGTAAGYGVTEDGETYEGPYEPGIYADDAPAFRIGPGVAPEARLYALKVFGCAGATNATIDAVDYAVRNDLDVVNLSLGASFGVSDDPLATALSNAADAGIVVVASAGNSGPAPYITGSPGSGESVISVAATNSIATIDVADLLTDDEVAVPDLQNSNGADLTEPVTGELVVLTDDPATSDVDESLGCRQEDFADVGEGDIVVAFRGVCPRIDRAVFGQVAGVEAVIFVNNVDGPPPVEGIIPEVRIPFLGATPEQGDQLVELAGETVTIVDGGTVPNPEFRQPAGFTSSGPRLDDSALKPDVAAPGVAIDSAFVGSGDRGLRLSGTSMAAPHTAGVAALLRQALPDRSVAELKARLINTADPDGVVGYETLRVGAGLIDPAQALAVDAVAFADREEVSLSFGFRQSSGTITRSQRVRLRNLGETPVTYSARVESSADADGTGEVQVLPQQITVEPGTTGFVRVQVTVGVPQTDPADFVAVAGTIAFEPVDAADRSTLRVPYLLVPDVTSRLKAQPPAVRLPDEPTTAELTVTNTSPVPGEVDVFAWGIADGADDPPIMQAPDLRAVGVQVLPEEDPAPENPQPAGVFAFALHEAVAAPARFEYDVLLDVDEDGTHDFAVVGKDAGLLLSGAPDGRLASFTVDLRPDEEGNPRFAIVNAFLADVGFNTSVVRLPFLLTDVGLTADENPDFTYTAATFGPDEIGADIGERDEGVDFGAGEGAFNAFDEPVGTGQVVTVPGGGVATIPVEIDPEQVEQTPVLGWLLVYPDDLAGLPQVDTVRLIGVPRLTAPPPSPPIDGPGPPGGGQAPVRPGEGLPGALPADPATTR